VYRSRGAAPLESTRALVISEKTGISATYQIPGMVDIPSDGAKHYVTIAKMKFTSKMLWYSIPKIDTRAYLKVSYVLSPILTRNRCTYLSQTSIKNESEYSFVPGNANVFVDGSFVATVPVPSACPQEVFDCPLG